MRDQREEWFKSGNKYLYKIFEDDLFKLLGDKNNNKTNQKANRK